MTYTGVVSAGGPADVRELTGLTVSKLCVGPMSNNAYLLRCTDTGDQVLIDAAAEPGRLLDLAGEAGLRAVVTTHKHGDHWAALADVVAATGATAYAHPLDAPALPVPTSPLNDGDTLGVGTCVLEVSHIRGHTPGSIVLLYRDPAGSPHLFTGDSLFPGGVGNTWGDPTNFGTLIDDVEHKLFDRLPDDTWFYPGHGNDSTLGAERPALPEWRARGW
jgi:glyoxylase-like metal-dependent hydrolase (beta-lactamase superfamily II)